MMIGETIEFDAPGIGKSTIKKSGRVLEDLGNGKLRIEIMVGGETTTMIVNPDAAKKPEKKAKPGRKPKAKPEAQLNLFPTEDFAKKLSSLQEDFEAQLGEIKALVSPAPDTSIRPTPEDISEETIVKADLYDFDFLGRMKYDFIILHRVHVPGHGRLYAVKFRQPDGEYGPTEFYTGVTTICDKVMGHSDELLNWALENFTSPEDYREKLNELADLGSFIHGMMAKCAMKQLPDFEDPEFDQMVRRGIGYYGYNVSDKFKEWSTRTRKAILSFKKWVWEYNVVFHAIEIPIGIPHSKDANGNKVFGWFNQIDFFVTMDKEQYPDAPKPKRNPLPEKCGTAAPEAGKKPRSWKKIQDGEPYESWIFPSRSQADSWAAGYHERWDGPCGIPEIGFEPVQALPPAGENETIQVTRQVERVQHYTPWDCPKDVERERIMAVADYKSGKNSYPSHALQLQLQKLTLEHNFPHLDFSKLRLFNLHTMDWEEGREKPTFGYSLREKTDEFYKTAESYLNIWRAEHARELPRKIVYAGDSNIGTHPRENTRLVEYRDYFDEKFSIAIKNGFINLKDL
jgi:hypothetical protein